MQAELRIADLPDHALDAVGLFHAEWMDRIAEVLGKDCDALAIVLPAATYDHEDWRRAAARDLARRYAPQRVNIVGGSDADRIAATLSYLAGAPGVTGQYLVTDGKTDDDRAQ